MNTALPYVEHRYGATPYLLYTGRAADVFVAVIDESRDLHAMDGGHLSTQVRLLCIASRVVTDTHRAGLRGVYLGWVKLGSWNVLFLLDCRFNGCMRIRGEI